MAPTDEMVAIALDIKPDYVTLVPEKREEVTTEGGLDVAGQTQRLNDIVAKLQDAGIPSAYLSTPIRSRSIQRQKSKLNSLSCIQGCYADAADEGSREKELAALAKGCEQAIAAGLRVNAGHGLTYWNVYPVACLEGMEELNIGHSIISRAALVGLERAVREMKQAMRGEL
jgi:pyridoxine 5-phosphate synthase